MAPSDNWESVSQGVSNSKENAWQPVVAKKRPSKPPLQMPYQNRVGPPYPPQSSGKSFHRSDDVTRGKSQVGSQERPPFPTEKVPSARDSYARNPAHAATGIPPKASSNPSAIPFRQGTGAAASKPAPAANQMMNKAPERAKPVAVTAPSQKKAAAKATDMFDLMMYLKAPSGNAKTQLDAASSRKTYEYRSKMDVNEECKARRFIATKQKKKFTKIKKRILMERLRNHMKKQAALAAAASGTDTDPSVGTVTDPGTAAKGEGSHLVKDATASSSGATTTLVLLQFVTADEIADPLEYEEVVSNIRELFSPFGLLRSIDIKLLRAIETVGAATDAESNEDKEQEEDEDECVVLVTFSDSSAAQAAVEAINGTVFGGQPIIAALRDVSDNDEIGADSPHYFSVDRSATEVGQPIEEDMTEKEEGYELHLKNSVFPDDIVEESEIMEVLEDLCSLCQVFGDISTVWIERNARSLSNVAESNKSDATVLAVPWVVIEYESTKIASASGIALNGICVGGEVIQAYLYSYSAYLAGIFDDEHCIDLDATLARCDGAVLTGHSSEAGAVIVVKNYISLDDLEECEGDIEQLGAMKRDLLALCSSEVLGLEEGEEVFVRRVVIVTSNDLMSEVTGVDATNGLAACVRYCSLSAASNAMLSLDGTLMGGAPLKASVRRFPARCNSLKTDASQSSSGQEIEIIAAKKIQRAKRQVAPQTVVSGDGSKYALSSGPEGDLTGPKQKKKVKSDPPVSLYKEAILVSKLDKSISSRRPIKVANEDVEGTVKELLGAIATFQQKLKERDPLKAAAKRRFVMGTKQSTNCVRSGLVKLLLLAPDSESSEALDGLLDVLLEEAERMEVPVLYCLNRRKLGKALKSSMKQVVVAVLDPDGAYGWFKKIVTYIKLPTEIQAIEADHTEKELAL